jgi:glycosyltransferase involved in cell wall biosynthesis
MGKNAREMIEKQYSLESVAERYLALYDELLSPGGK